MNSMTEIKAEYRPIPKKIPRFNLGKVDKATKLVIQAGISVPEITNALLRHHRGDWGVDGDSESNEISLQTESELLSKYRDENGVCYWVRTNPARTRTDIFLPSEYTGIGE
jgi:hypothetical protein